MSDDGPELESSALVPTPPPDPRAARWVLLRDVVVLQGKLILDGLKDLVLAPVSIVAAIFGLVFEPRQPGRSFYALMRAGRDFERWVDLYGGGQHDDGPPLGLDAHVRRLEALVLERHRKGGLTRQAKDAIDRAIDAVQADRPAGDPSARPTGDPPA